MTQDARVKDQVKAEILEMALAALREAMDSQGNQRIGISPHTVLYGVGSDVDSLALIELLVNLEKRIQDRYGLTLAVTHEQAMSQEESPFRTVSTLAEYLAELVAERPSVSGAG